MAPFIRLFKSLWLPLASLAVIVLVAQLLASSSSQRLANLSTRVAEFFLVDADGLRLGSRPASSQIVLVLYDDKSAETLGSLRSYDRDIQLYNRLSKARASVVCDTRGLGIASEENLTETLALLDCLHAFNKQSYLDRDSEDPEVNKTVFMYDAYIAAQIGERDLRKYSVFSAINPLPMKPHKQPFLRERLYPLGFHATLGLQETPPLKISRHFWHGELADIALEFARCGVLTELHRQFPQRTSPFDEVADDYILVDKKIPWSPIEITQTSIVPAGFEVSHDPAVNDYRQLSYVDVLNSENPESLDLAGRVVIVGNAFAQDPTADLYELPSGRGKMAAAHMIALATQTILDGRWLRHPSNWANFFGLVGFCGCMLLSSMRLRPLWAVLVGAGLLVLYFAVATMYHRSGWKTDFLFIPCAGIVASISGISIQAWQHFRSHLRVVDMFGRYVPRAVVNQLILQPELDALKLGGTKREVTVLFADIRGFTSFSEKMPPDQVVAELNSLLKVMVDCTFEFQGTLDKFIGDAILVLFNAPLNQEDHVQRAVKMALEMQSRIAKHSTQLSIGIGIHMGEAVVGNIGTPQRMEYTAIGSTVNIASRLCDQAQAGKVVVSQQVYELVRSQFQSESLGSVKVKGITEAIAMWSITEKSA